MSLFSGVFGSLIAERALDPDLDVMSSGIRVDREHDSRSSVNLLICWAVNAGYPGERISTVIMVGI